MECINPLMHMGPVKLDSARFSWKCDISVSAEFPATTTGRRIPRDAAGKREAKLCDATGKMKRCYSLARLMAIHRVLDRIVRDIGAFKTHPFRALSKKIHELSIRDANERVAINIHQYSCTELAVIVTTRNARSSTHLNIAANF